MIKHRRSPGAALDQSSLGGAAGVEPEIDKVSELGVSESPSQCDLGRVNIRDCTALASGDPATPETVCRCKPVTTRPPAPEPICTTLETSPRRPQASPEPPSPTTTQHEPEIPSPMETSTKPAPASRTMYEGEDDAERRETAVGGSRRRAGQQRLEYTGLDDDGHPLNHVHPHTDPAEKSSPKQFGVLKMEAIIERLRARSSRWGVRSIYIAMYILSTITSTENNSLPLIEPYFLSLFGHHSSLATVGIMTNIAFAVGKPPMSKIMDVFGRAEGVLVAIILYLIGAILTASSTGVIQYGFGRTAAALGSQGLQLSQMIIVADTSSLTSRALLTSTITSPWIFTTWIGPVVGSWFLSKGAFGYRTIYLVFGLAVPLCASWLVLVLWMEWRKLNSEAGPPARRIALPTSDLDQEDQPGGLWSPPNSPNTILYNSRSSSTSLWSEAWEQLDSVGLVLLTLGFGLLLLPLTWSVKEPGVSWFTVTRCSFFIVGVIVLVCFGIYENKFAKFPVIPPRLVEQRTVLLGSAVCFWHFICQFTYESYFTSFLQVARFLSARDAQYVERSYLFTACVSAIICGLLVKWTRRYKIWLVVGILLHAVGTLLMVRSRKLDNPMIEIVISQVIGGFGGGFTTLASQLGVQAVVAHQDVGISTAVFLTITQIGGAVGSSLAGSIWTSRLETALSERLPASERGNIPKIVGDLRFALTYQGDKRTKINEAYVDVQRILNWLGVWALLPCLICALCMQNVDLDSKAVQAQPPEGRPPSSARG
ncbi:hypothetical protein PTTG_01301 [Puccinia triticina 1-1 BBBD Race 1]|uniref:MFS domain-containing protein n=1 Tax=Puccinia triticina (isolate 1-1 / race 1 (BBBD)) TaxID=630390 RepID=A0A180GYU8_PUCT1|nr:hypothetical protein PTTG_01301 [Puccinia triticina 1-1 BBBD Race 1]